MLAEPRPAHVPVGPGRLADALADGIGGAPDVDVMVRNPTREAIGFFRCLLPGFTQVVDEVEERSGALTKIAGFSRPVVHLDIDVGSPVRTPGRSYLVIPNAL